MTVGAGIGALPGVADVLLVVETGGCCAGVALPGVVTVGVDVGAPAGEVVDCAAVVVDWASPANGDRARAKTTVNANRAAPRSSEVKPPPCNTPHSESFPMMSHPKKRRGPDTNHPALSLTLVCAFWIVLDSRITVWRKNISAPYQSNAPR